MAGGTNEAERRRWNDQRWAQAWPKREVLTDAVTAYVLEALAPVPGERVLDVGSGGGRTSVAVAAAVEPGGSVVGADISAPLVALATQRAAQAGASNVSFTVADVQTDPLPGGPFDAAVSQFGVMFFDEPVFAFRNIRAHLRPGGRLVFACWQPLERNQWCAATVLGAFVAPPPEPEPGKSPVGPFTLGDPDHTRSVLDDAGFEAVERSSYEIEVEVPANSVVDDVQLRLFGVSEEDLADARAAVDANMRQFATKSGLSRIPLAFQLFAAANPADDA